jgi:hypothetical protein
MSEMDKGREEEGNEPEIKITDRRLFTSEGELRGEIEEEEERKEEAPVQTSAAVEPDAPSAPPAEQELGFEHHPVEEPSGVDFTMLLNAMAQPVLVFLGEIPDPDGSPRVDLEQARIQIDMLELLKVKCRGNLTANEDGLLDRILYQLRMLYVSKSGQDGPA